MNKSINYSARSSQRKISSSQRAAAAELPSWILDVEEEDDVAGDDLTLLEELEIDPSHIFRSMRWMVLGPCARLCGKTTKRHPLHSSGPQLSSNRSIDFWGPCGVVSLFGLVLWLGRVRDVPWIFVIWAITAALCHFTTRVWHRSTLMIHVALLGYSVTPLVPFATLILFIRLPIWLATVFEICSVLWASAAAILSYTLIFSVPPQDKPRLALLFPLVVLMEMYYISLLPIRHR